MCAAELSVRHLVFLEAAVERNPKNPDWDGLDIILSAVVNAKGKIEVCSFQQ